MTLTAQRNGYWDSLKFFLIFLVVFGHVNGLCREISTLNLAVDNFIYLFHMPLFVFISGRFSVIRNRGGYKTKIIKLLETFLVFHLLWCLINFFILNSLLNKIIQGQKTAPRWYAIVRQELLPPLKFMQKSLVSSLRKRDLKTFQSE